MTRIHKDILITLVAVFTITAGLFLAGAFRTADLKLTDAFLRLHADPQAAARDRVIYAVIASSSLQAADQLYGMGWPWRRKYYGRLTELAGLCGARAVVMDMIFSERSIYRVSEQPPFVPEDDDALFAAALRASGRAVLGFGGTDLRQAVRPFPARHALAAAGGQVPVHALSGVLAPLPVLADSAAALGCFSTVQDRDGLIRRVPPLVRYEGGLYPTLALAAWRLAHPGAPPRLEAGMLVAGRARLPLDRQGYVRLRYHGDNNVYYDFNVIHAFLALDKMKRHHAEFSRLKGGTPPLTLEQVARSRAAYAMMLDDLNTAWLADYRARFLARIGVPLPAVPAGKNGADPEVMLPLIAGLPAAALARLGDPAHLQKDPAKLGEALTRAGLDFDPRTPPMLGLKLWRHEGKIVKREPLFPWLLKDAFVILGGTSSGLRDIVATPFNAMEAGMHIHATLLDNLLQGQALREVESPLLYLLLILLAAAVTSWAGYALSARGLVLTALGGLLLLAGGSLLLTRGGTILFPVAPCFALLAAFLTVTTVNRVRERQQKQYLHHAFGQYLSPKIVETLIKNPEKLKLGGERKEMTALFSDLQGFSTISEGLTPEALVALLNDYLSRMCAIISAEGGIIDKFEGDAIIAFWGAPLEQYDHSIGACRAALRMDREMVRLREEFRAAGRPELYMRIGINSGPMVVGNMGSSERMDYTIMGDAVNLASRLEGANKLYGTWILISEHTRALLAGRMATREVDRIRVMGKQEPVTVYELLGERGG